MEINVLACDGNYAIIEGINKNLDGGRDEDAYIDVSKFDFDNCNSDDYE